MNNETYKHDTQDARIWVGQIRLGPTVTGAKCRVTIKERRPCASIDGYVFEIEGRPVTGRWISAAAIPSRWPLVAAGQRLDTPAYLSLEEFIAYNKGVADERERCVRIARAERDYRNSLGAQNNALHACDQIVQKIEAAPAVLAEL